MFSIRKFFKKKCSQRTFVYCPRCNNELVRNGHFIKDNDGIVKYECSKCGNVSFWDFAHFPVPCLRTCADCSHIKFNNSGEAYCSENCDPQTQALFEYAVMTADETKGET